MSLLFEQPVVVETAFTVQENPLHGASPETVSVGTALWNSIVSRKGCDRACVSIGSLGESPRKTGNLTYVLGWATCSDLVRAHVSLAASYGSHIFVDRQPS